MIAISAAVLVLGGGGAAAWTLLGRGHAQHTAGGRGASSPGQRPGTGGGNSAGPLGTASPGTLPATTQPVTTAPAPTEPFTTAPATTQPATTQPGGAGSVTIAPGAGQQADAQQVAAFLRTWFQAINARDYGTYISLYVPQLRPTLQQFRQGYRSTRDSGAVLASVSGTGTGLAAEVTFTSHQRPGDSPSSSSCTSWDITLYLVPSGGSYEITHAPPGYHSRYQAC